MGPVADVAEFTQALYSTRAPKIVPAEAQAQLTNFTSPSGWSFYGMGTFDLGWSIGKGEKAWGHVGDTYGYQSQTTYFEGRDFSLAVATNIESGNQAQPADGTCRGYHAIAAALDGVAQPNCSFTVPFGRKFIGTCKCE